VALGLFLIEGNALKHEDMQYLQSAFYSPSCVV